MTEINAIFKNYHNFKFADKGYLRLLTPVWECVYFINPFDTDTWAISCDF